MKMKLNTTLFIASIFVTGCEMFQSKTTDSTNASSSINKGSATAERINGIYVFLKSYPAMDYDNIGSYEITWFEQANKFLHLKGEKIGEVLSDFTQTANYNKKIEMMIDSVKTKFPDTEGIIFRQNMLTCDAIKFKN